MDALIPEFQRQMHALTETGFQKISEYFQHDFDWASVLITAKSYTQLAVEQATRSSSLLLNDYMLPGQDWLLQGLREFRFWISSLNWLPILVALCCFILGLQLLERVSPFLNFGFSQDSIHHKYVFNEFLRLMTTDTLTKNGETSGIPYGTVLKCGINEGR